MLAEDCLGVTVIDIGLHPGIKQVHAYDNRVEITYCDAPDRASQTFFRQ